jgi:hypothetical protein
VSPSEWLVVWGTDDIKLYGGSPTQCLSRVDIVGICTRIVVYICPQCHKTSCCYK